MSKSDEPAWGERNAVTGYYPQYRISAALVIRGLREGSLIWIAVADPKAGRVDDFQIATEQRVDAYQFKWSRYGGNVTFNDLVKSPDSAPSLIRQLADGWQRLRTAHPRHRVVVHLTTNQQPSSSPSVSLPVGNPAPEPRHFAAFIEQAWKPAHTVTSPEHVAVPAVWQATWDAVRNASGLGEADFREFAHDCELEFGRNLPETAGLSTRDAEIFEKDLDHVTHKLFAAVYDPQHVVRLSRDKLLGRLGWKDRFEYRNRHSFPVNEVLYQPIDDSREALERSLNELGGGYVAVLGTPGSGKSTLLTQTLRYLPQRVIRYYAYIPDAQSSAVRGESINFLYDVVRTIEETGFRPGQSINHPDREHLRERLHEQLRLLHLDWQQTRIKTIILVDGLDHIPREQHPAHSLLYDLPPPDQIPEGVYLVLGSQTDQLDGLPSSVQFAIRQPERRIEMGPLSREAVRHITEKADLRHPLSPEQMDRLYELSAGHPLALIYLLQELERAEDAGAVEHVLLNAPPYRGRIEEQYHGYWRQIDEDDELANLMGLVARVRGVIDLQWIETWAQPVVVRRLRRKFVHLFRTEDHNRWYFFHNSFRLFVNERSAQSAPGVFDPARDRALHHELALKYRESSDVRWRWEEVYHLYKSEADGELLQRVGPDFFRDQFLNFRSVEAVRTDIALALRAAGRRRDLIPFVRLLLSDAEMSQREANTERFPVAPLLLSLGEEHAALEYLRDGQRLRVSPESALENAVTLVLDGMEREARQLFDLAEPLEYLSGAKVVERYGHSEEQERLKVWAKAAVHFRPVDKVIAAIKRVRVEPDRHALQAQVDENRTISVAEVESEGGPEAQSDADSLHLQDGLMFRAGTELIEERRWDELAEVESALLSENVEGEEWWFGLRVKSWRASQADGDLSRALQVLTETSAKVNRDSTGDERRTVIAEGLLRIADDEKQARLWLKGATPLGLQKIPDFNFNFTVFNYLFRYARLLYAFGDKRRPAEIIPEPPAPGQLGSAYVQRGVCTVARIWAESWRGRKLDHATIRQEVFPLLRLFYHGWRDTKWDSWHTLTELKSDFYDLLISAVALHGPEPLQALAEDFAREWDGNSRYWPSKVIREIALALHTAGINKEWASEQFERVERLVAGDEVLVRVEEGVKQADAWLELGVGDRARASLRQALIDSSSVGSKDFQLGEWIAWMERANKLEPDGAPERVAWFAQAVVDLERNGGPSRDAAYDLLEAVFHWSPRRAVTLFRWFLEGGLIHFDDAVRTMLRAALALPADSSRYVAAILTHLLLPISDVDYELLRRLVKRLHEKSGEGSAINFAREFTSAVEIYSLPSRRRGWRRGVARGLKDCSIEISTAGLSENDLSYEKNHGSNEGLLLKDGTKLTTDAVREKASTLDGLRILMQQGDGSFYHWDEIVSDLIPALSSTAEVLEVVEFFSRGHYSARILGMLAKRLRDLGDIENARRIARIVLGGVGPGGWVVQLSGATNVAAYQVLTAIDGQSARDEAFAHLVEDMTGSFRYPGYTVQNLGEILPLLTAEVPETEVWHEIEPYVHSLFPGADDEGVDSSLLEALRVRPDTDTPTQAFADLLSLHIAHPIKVLSNPAQSILIRLLIEGDQTARDSVRRLMQEGEGEQESTLMMLDATSTRNSDIAVGFEDQLHELSASPNFAIRIVAQRISQSIGITLPVIYSEGAAVSSLYGLSLPPGRETEDVWDESSRTEFDFLPDTDDPYELLKIQLPYFEWAADHAGVPMENVVQRAGQIVSELTREDEWAAQGEKGLRSRFNNAGLEYAYTRPRATIARRAFFHVVAELADAGKLRVSSLEGMKPTFDYYDSEMFFITPVARPEFVFPWPGGRHRQNITPASGSEGRDDFPLLRTSEGLIIFGEYTKIKRLEWETPTLVRQSLIGTAPPNEKEGRHSFFHRESFCLVQEYPYLSRKQDSPPLIIRHECRMYDSPDPEWMAFNPELARALGWVPVDDYLFGWVDENGRMMAWSIWWKDGLYQSQPPKFEDDVGEGWAVVGSLEALENIIELMGSHLTQYLRVEEEWREKGERKSKVKQVRRLIEEAVHGDEDSE